ncbi:MAG: hypothetical protein K2Q10_02130, partial [Rhodospirillales bacterium]|nr:hypothetical protein [Rhodospirillales bacterium]
MRRLSGQRHKIWNVSTRVENALARLREGLPGGDTVPRLILAVYTAAALYNILLEYRDLRDELRHGSDHLFGIGAEYLHTVLHATAGILEDLDANQRLSAIDDHALDGLLRGKEHILLDLEGLAVIDAQGRRRA